MQVFKTLAVCLAVAMAGGCGSDTNSKAAECSASDVRRWAYDSLKDYYLFYDQVPNVNPATYDSAENLVEELRVAPYDYFSRVTTTSGDQEVFVEGKSFGIGSIWQRDNADELTVAAVFGDSPLGRAGIERGDKLLSINNVQLKDLTNEQYARFVGTREEPGTANWTFQDSVTNQQNVVSLTPALFDINSVLHSETISLPDYSEKIGYLVLESFIGTSEAELDAAIADFKRDDVKELILDLRYNGGGLVSVATRLASQIAGPSTDDKMLMEYRHNNNYSEFDFTLDFEGVSGALNLERLVVLTTGYTASASELVVNALSPYIEVVTIGSHSVGKPYISFGNDYCGKRLHALQAEGFNANNVSVYGGISPSCGSSDDLTRDFGMSSVGPGTEAMLDDALNYLVNGTCKTPLQAANPSLQSDDTQQQGLIDAFSKRVEGNARINRAIID